MEEKEILVAKTNELKIKHEQIKADMIKILEASQILNTQYGDLEQKLYKVEEEYIETMKKLI
jgi:hypothetical protein